MCTKLRPLLLWVAVLLPVTILGSVQQDSTRVKETPDFTGVDVVVETEWGTSDRTENVEVFIKKTPDGHTDIVMKKSNHQECIVELVPGITVKIIDRKSKKVLKTFKK